jgi:HEAT repeat protein
VADLRHGVAAQEGPGPAAAPRRKPLPPRPRDEAERLRGLLHLLEWGDKDLVLFAQRVLAEHPDPAAVAAAVAKAGEANLRVNLPYVGNLLGAVADERAGRAMEGFLLACLDCGDPSVREKALRIYARSLPEKALPVVAARCTDHWPRTAQAALRELETRPGAEASAALREAFPRVSTFARASACATLGRLGDPASIPILAEAMEDARRRGDNEVTVFLGAAEGLAALGDARGVEALRACVRALPPQRPAVPMDFPREQWGGPEAALARLHDGVLRDRLLMQARRAPPEAAAAALRLLSTEYPADPEILGAYRAALERADGDFVLWAEALAALRAAGNADALARTLAALESPELDRRYAATLALGRFRDPSTVKPLVDRLGREQDPGVARKICDALGLLGDPAAAPALVKFLREDPSPTPDRA